MKVIVTGGCGFIGSHSVDRLLNEGHEVICLDNFSTGRLENIGHHQNSSRLKVIECDLSLHQSLNDLLKRGSFDDVELVFHFAALADIVPSITNPRKYFEANVIGTLNLLETCRHLKLRKFIYAASSSCYGIPDIYPTPETAEIRPQYPYATTKFLGEQLVLDWHRIYHVPSISLRFFNVYGPRSRTSGTYGAVFGVFLAQKLNGAPFTIVGDGHQTRDFTYVTDVVDACYRASFSNVVGETMNVGSGNHYSVNYLVELLGGEKVYIPKRPGEPDCTYADISKIKTLLGWHPTVSFEDGVQKMLENIDYWRAAPVWTAQTIEQETQDWFKYLSKN